MDFFSSWAYMLIMLVLLVGVLVIAPIAIIAVLIYNRPRDTQKDDEY